MNLTLTAACCPIALRPATVNKVGAVNFIYIFSGYHYTDVVPELGIAADEDGGTGSWNCTCASDKTLLKEEHAVLRDRSCFTSCNCTSGMQNLLSDSEFQIYEPCID